MPLEFGPWAWEWATWQGGHIQAHFEDQIIGDGWLYRQDEKVQRQVLNGAPPEFIQRVSPRLKPKVAVELGANPFIRRTE